MADPLYVLPDPVLAVIQYLRARAEVTTLAPSDHIVTALPSTMSGQYVVVNLASSDGIWPAIDDAAVQIDAIGGDKAACSLLARTVRAAIWAIRNDTVAACLLASGSEEVGPQWLPDMTPTIPLSRFTARYSVLLTK